MKTQCIAAEVRAAIARQDVRHSVIAERVQLSPTQLSRRLAGAIEFSGSELAALAEVLEVPVTTFFPAADVRTGTGG